MVNNVECKGIRFYLSHGQQGTESDWLPLQQRLHRRLCPYLRHRLARCAGGDQSTLEDVEKRTWQEFSSRELDSLLERLDRNGSVWLAFREVARHQLLLWQCRRLAEPLPESGDGAPPSQGPSCLSPADRLGLCHYLSHGEVGQDSDWRVMHTAVECELRPYLISGLAWYDCRDLDTVEDLLERVWVVFCARTPERLLLVVEGYGSVADYARQLARDQLNVYARRQLLRQKAEKAMAHQANAVAPVILSQARLARILEELNETLSRSHRQWLRDQLQTPDGPDKIPLTLKERKRLQRVLKAVRAYVDKGWSF